MQLAYQAEGHTAEHLAKLISQHNSKAATMNSFIENAITDNSRRIEERIKRRQMKSMAAKSTVDAPEGAAMKNLKRNLPGIVAIAEEPLPTNDSVARIKRKRSLECMHNRTD